MGDRRRLAVLALGLAVLAAGLPGAGCSGTTRLDAPYAGRTYVYEPGEPNFDLAAAGALQDGRPGIDLYLGIPYASLIFVPREGGYRARFEVLIRLLDDKGKTLLAEYVDADTVETPDYEATQAFEPFLKKRRLAAEPGDYVLDVVLTDPQSNRQARRRQRVSVVAAGSARPLLSQILLEGKRRGRPFEPILSLHAPEGLDSLRAVVALYNARRLGDVEVTMRLTRFPGDTAAARPPYQYTVSTVYGMVRYDDPDTLQVTRRLLPDVEEEVAIEFDLPGLEQGIYRVDVSAGEPGAEAADKKALLRQRRDFAVRGADFPKVVTLDEMVEALSYIARTQESDHIREAGTPAEKKRRFDAFWGALLANRNLAANLLRLYYSRVEEANLVYTTYKEGWKTDRGMVFIVLGSPLYVDRLVDREVWYYSYDDRDALRAFVFERRVLYQSGGLFEAYVLRRELFYEPEWRRAVESWRRGDVL